MSGPTSRKEAMISGTKRYRPGVLCKHGHDCERYTKRGDCVQCRAALVTRWRRANTERYSASTKSWRDRNIEHARRLFSDIAARRRARIVNATPSWAPLGEISEIYKNRPPGMDVDHIVPIASKLVCGLHVPWNLQYLDPRTNKSKSNKVIQHA